MEHTTRRQRIRVSGVVQGVGFRPHVYTLAVRHGLAGFVGNDSVGVFIEIEGPTPALAAFLEELKHDPPPLASIDSLDACDIEAENTAGFSIHQSHCLAGESTPVPPDIATCADCLAELFEPTNRRYR